MGISGLYQLPNWSAVTVGGETINTLDPANVNNILRNIQQSIAALSGQAGGGANIYGALSLNSNTVSGVTNSATPTDDEAVSYGLAQSQYTAWRQNTKAVNANYLVQAGDGTILASAGPVPITVTLLAPSSVTGQVFPVKRLTAGSSVVNVLAAGGGKIDGSASDILSAQYSCHVYQSDGTDYQIIAKF